MLAVAKLSELVVDVAGLKSRYEDLKIKNKGELAFSGGNLTKELGMRPGPLFGKILATLEQKVVAGDLNNSHDVLLAEAQTMAEKAKK